MTTLTINIKDTSQLSSIKKILKEFDVEVIETSSEITNPEIIERLEKHYENFQNPEYRKQNYLKVNSKDLWSDIQLK